jgi:hypothetical protein
MQVPKLQFRLFSGGDRSIFLISLLIACMFWIASRFSQRYVHDYVFNVEYEYPDDLSFATAPVRHITAELSSNGWDLFRTSLKSDFNVLKVSSGYNGENRISRSVLIDLIKQKLNNPAIGVSSINVDALEFNFEDKISKTVKVNLLGSIGYGPGVTLKESVTIQPDVITVTGPVSLVQGINSWSTETVVFENITSDNSKNVKLKPASNDLISTDIKEVVVTVPVEQVTEKSFYVPVSFDTSGVYKLFPNKILVTCTVGLSKYDLVKKEMFAFGLPTSFEPMNQGSVPVQLIKKPDFILNVQYRPNSVQFFLLGQTNEEGDVSEPGE